MAYYCAGAQGTPHLCPREDNYPQATELSLNFERQEEQSGTTPALSHFCLAALPSAGFRIVTFIPRKFSDCVFVLINSVLFHVFGSCFRMLAVILVSDYFFYGVIFFKTDIYF